MVQMKYFGDSRDYFKYDLIAWILGGASIQNYVFVPMLTEHRDDMEGRTRPRKSEEKSADLFEFIESCSGRPKSLRNWEAWLGPRAGKYETCEPVDALFFAHESRENYWESFWPILSRDYALVFLDPDTGLETRNHGYMRKAGFEKYILNSELKRIIEALGASSVAMIYQHLPRNKNEHESAVDKRVRQIQKIAPEAHVSAIREDDLAFLFICKEKALHDLLQDLLKGYNAKSKHKYKSLHITRKEMNEQEVGLDTLKLIEKAIRDAGKLLKQIAARPLDVLNADGKDIKLQADRDSEEQIIAALRAGSDYPILCEERGELGGQIGANFDGPYWVIDPLDGTLNYSRQIPVCCISIALVDGSNGGEKPLAGAVYDFNRDELFTAAAGQGAWMNGKPMRVSSVIDPSQGVISTGFPSAADYSTEGLLPLVRRVQQFKKVRMIGAAAVSLAWVACGRIDAYAEDDVMLWDIAAGVLLVAEAGGMSEFSVSAKKKWTRNVKVGSDPRIWPKED